MSSLTARLTRLSVGLLLAVLGATGVLTASLLYILQLRALDDTLVAAALAFGDHDWDSVHTESSVTVVRASEQERRLYWREDESPVWTDEGEERVLYLPVEVKGEDGEDSDEHQLVIARAPRVSILGSLGAFSLAYGFASSAVVAVGAWLQRRLVLVAVRPLREATGSLSRVMGAGQGARVCEEGPDEVRSLLKAINSLLGRLDRAALVQARFTAEAAHELRTPVAVMLGELDVVLRRPRSDIELRDALVSSREEVRRLAELVDGLLLLARIDAGQAEQGRERVRVRELIEEARRREGAQIIGAGGHLDVRVEGEPWVEVHAALIVSAIANLLRNAARHAPGSRVSVEARLVDESVVILVEDDGPGVLPDDRESVFDRLSRGTRARQHGGGLGLGLPLTREVARRHGGDCWMEPGPGCRVRMRLPSSDAPHGRPA